MPRSNTQRQQVANIGNNVFGIFYVDDADWVDDVMNKVDPDDYESLQYFERVLRTSGIIKALQKAGVKEGDTVSICGVEFDYVP